MCEAIKLARKYYILHNGYDSLTGSATNSEDESEDGSDHKLYDKCEGCNMDHDDEDVYEFSPVKISPNKMVTIFANEYAQFDRKSGKGMLRNNDSLIPDLSYLTSADKTLDTINTFQKVVTTPITTMKSPKRAHHISDETPLFKVPFHTVARDYINEDGIRVYEVPTTAKDIENMKKIIAEVKAGKLK